MGVSLNAENYILLPQTVEIIHRALGARQPFSLVRLGDGELIVLAQETVFPLDWITSNVGWANSSNYCGVQLPDLPYRDRMLDAIRSADMVGVFAGDDLTTRVFDAIQIQPRSICYAFDNVYMPMYKPFVDLIRRYPPLLVGRPAEPFAAYLREKLGVVAAGTVSINDAAEIDACVERMAAIPHDWSLVSAGCNAVIIAHLMASRYGKVCIDFGHAPDNAMSPDYPDYWLAVD